LELLVLRAFGCIDFGSLRSTATRFGENHRWQIEGGKSGVKMMTVGGQRWAAFVTKDEPT
jgi:hypothetical protein